MADDHDPPLFTVRFTKEERDAVIDALSRVIAGEYDGDIPIEFFESALEKV